MISSEASRRRTAVRLAGVTTDRDGRSGRVDGCDLELREGEFVALVGRSGAGKTALLRLVAGLAVPSSGAVYLGEQSVAGPQPGVGFAPQSAALVPWRTVLDNVLLRADLSRATAAAHSQALACARRLLALLELSGREDAWVFGLAEAERRAVAICRAVLDRPAIWLIDEPFVGLGSLARERLALALEHLWIQAPAAALLATESVAEAVLLADRVVVLSAGRIVREFQVDLPRPRRFDRATLPLIAEHSSRIRICLESLTP